MMKNPEETLDDLPENVFIDTAMSAELEDSGEFEEIIPEIRAGADHVRLRFPVREPESRDPKDQGQQLFRQRERGDAVEKRCENIKVGEETAGEFLESISGGICQNL